MYYKHGDSKTKLYRLWKTMKSRCNDPNRPHFDRYGGRGIKVCEEWNSNYTSFKEWSLKNGYKDGLTLDRINNNGNYEPNNCRWVNRKEQAYNRCDSLRFEINNEILDTRDMYNRYHIHIQSLISWRKKGIINEKLKERTGQKVIITGGKLLWVKE